MEKKRLTKYVWYGSDVDKEGNPILPNVASEENHLDGLNRGELFIHNASNGTTLWTVSEDGKIVQISGVSIEELEKIFLRKDKDDRSVGTISSDKGFEVGDYVPGELGIGGIFKIDENGDSYLEVDKALFRKIAYFVEIMIKKLSHVGGSIILSPASMKCSKVDEHETYYRCYFENEHEGKTINQEFVVGDQARSQTFNIKEGLSQNVSNQYYWRLVVGVGSNYIDLSKADCDSGSGIPLAGDDIVQLGNRNNPERQNAIILSSYGEGTPSFRQYKKIHTYSMSDAELVTEFSPESNLITGKFISKSGKDLEEEFLEAKVDWDKVLEQTDKEFSMWFFPYSPSADVAPEVDWVTPELKALHEEDLFYNTDDKSEDGGKAWRYTFEDGSYFWEIVTDAETIKALEKASKAQETADEKIRNFITEDNVLPPPPYDKGDRWSNANYVEGDVIHAEDDDMVCITPKAKGEEPSINDWEFSSSMNSDTKKDIEASIKNLGDRIELNVESIDALNKAYANLGIRIDGVAEEVAIYAKKTSDNETSIAELKLKTNSIEQSVSNTQGGVEEAKELASTARSLAITASMTGMYSGEEYNQTTNPWQNWSSGTEYKHVGAIWYNPNTGVTKRYIGTDGTNSWETVDDNVYSSATFVFQNKSKWSVVAANFNDDGSVKGNSGIVTTSDYAALFSEQWNENESVRAEIGTFVTQNADGTLNSNVKITADNVDINNGVVIIDKDSATIGGFTVCKDYIISTSTYKMEIINNEEGSGCIKWTGGDRLYARVGAWSASGYISGSLDVSNSIGYSSTIIPATIRTSGQNFQAEMNVFNYFEGSFTITKLGASGGQKATFGMDSNGRIRIGASLWPTSAQVNYGEVYNDDGTLKIKT